MKARLVLVNPDRAVTAPAAPMIVTLNDDGNVVLCGDWWARPLPGVDLASVTALEVRNALSERPGEPVEIYLTEERELPTDELMSPGYVQWVRQ